MPTDQPQPPGAQEKPMSRSARKSAEIRAGLKPLEHGERPIAVTVAALLALGLAIANLVAWVLTDSQDQTSDLNFQTAAQLIVLVICAVGMWKAKYWAVMGFQTLLALGIVIFGLSLFVVDKWTGALVLFVLAVGCGTMFWYLVRALARLQMPLPPASRSATPSADE